MRKFKNIKLVLIILAGFILRIFAILTDPFLHPWDERFHALVSRNMISNPFVPNLRVNPATFNFNPNIWCCNYIWLHKQPLFMWQMALSMKIFGVSEWSMRLPSAIMGSILVILIYRITFILTTNKSVALTSALFLAFSNFHLQLISGIHGMDHNDVAHGFYILCSIWAFCEYTINKKWYWVVFIGIFSGAAILNKWLTGLFVYLVWSLMIMLGFFYNKIDTKKIIDIIISLFICCLIFIPWQLYIFHRFPDLAEYEYSFNKRHITEALEGHSGSVFFYFEHLKDLIGNYIYILILIGFAFTLKHKKVKSNLNISIFISMLFVLFFYSLIVKTKVDTYIFFIVPFCFIYIAYFIFYLFNSVIKNKILYIISICCCAFLILNPMQIINYTSNTNIERNNRIDNAILYKKIKYTLPKDVKVVMNMNSFEDIDVMFYNNGITAYHWTLPEIDFVNFKKNKIKIAVFKPHGDYNLPKYVIEYPYLFIINEDLRNF
jgi:4-amino-4-deoxy-L-arabinose transferase-like glycosyltransferase